MCPSRHGKIGDDQYSLLVVLPPLIVLAVPHLVCPLSRHSFEARNSVYWHTYD